MHKRADNPDSMLKCVVHVPVIKCRVHCALVYVVYTDNMCYEGIHTKSFLSGSLQDKKHLKEEAEKLTSSGLQSTQQCERLAAEVLNLTRQNKELQRKADRVEGAMEKVPYSRSGHLLCRLQYLPILNVL